jgi:uncharacterized metal-binding protein YceD (DUF177 family)
LIHHAPDPAAPEFSRPLIVDRVPRAGSTEKIKADPSELLALATRLGLPAIHALSAEIRCTPWRGGGLKLEGTITADLEQVSVVSLEAFRQTLMITMQRYFVPPGAVSGSDDDDADPIVGGVVDLGEVTAETLALDLDPYPRKTGEAFSAHIEDDDGPGKADSPFAALARKPGE